MSTTEPSEKDHCQCDGNGWIDCWSCGGEGDYHDCGEDTCCCAEPDFDERIDCDECGGKGGWPHVRAKKTMTEPPSEQEPRDGDLPTLCPQCGPHVEVDEDGCCEICGATAAGDGAEHVLSELWSLRATVAKLTEERDAATARVAELEAQVRYDAQLLRQKTASVEEFNTLRAQLAERDGYVAVAQDLLFRCRTVTKMVAGTLDQEVTDFLNDAKAIAAAHNERVRAEEQQRIITELTHWARRFAHVADPNTAAEVARQFDRAIAALSTAGKEET